MALVLGLLGAFAGVGAGAAAGLWLGARARGNRLRYWLWNAVAFVAGFLVTFSGQVTGQLWLAFGGVGLIAGALTGLRYGYGQPLGPWKALDRFAHAENLPERREGHEEL